MKDGSMLIVLLGFFALTSAKGCRDLRALSENSFSPGIEFVPLKINKPK